MPSPPATASRRSRLDEAELRERAAKADAYLDLAQRTQADFDNYRKRMAREVRAAEARGISRLARELLPALDNLERAVAAVEAADPDHHLSAGIKLVTAELAAALGRTGIQGYSPAGEAVRSQPARGRGAAAGRGRRVRDGRAGAAVRLQPRRGGPAARAGDRGELGSCDGCPGPLQGARRRPQGDAGRDQEGVPQARAPVPPGQEPGRREGRGALQADLGRARHPRRRRQAQGLRPRAVEPVLAGGSRRQRPAGLRRGRLRRHPVRPVRPGHARPRRRRRRRCAAARARGARPRPRGGDLDRLRSGDPRRRGPDLRPDVRALRDLRRDGREARHRADRLPALPGPRRRGRGPGPVLDLPAVLAVRRGRHDHRVAVPDVPGRGPQPHREALPRQRARGRARGQPDPARRARASRARTAARPATCSSSRTCQTRRCSRARARTSRSRCR